MSTTFAAASTTIKWVAPTGRAALIAIASGKAAGMRGLNSNFRLPEGYGTPGYVPTVRGQDVYILCAVTISVASFVVVARLITRRVVTGWLGMEDYMMLPALVC